MDFLLQERLFHYFKEKFQKAMNSSDGKKAH